MRGASAIEQQLKDLVAARMELDAIDQSSTNRSARSLGSTGSAGSSGSAGSAALESLEAQRTSAVSFTGTRQKAGRNTFCTACEEKDVPARLRPKRYRTQDSLKSGWDATTRGRIPHHATGARQRSVFHLEGYPEVMCAAHRRPLRCPFRLAPGCL